MNICEQTNISMDAREDKKMMVILEMALKEKLHHWIPFTRDVTWTKQI